MAGYVLRLFTRVVMLRIPIEFGRQNSRCSCKGYVMKVYNGQVLMACLPSK